MKFGRVPDTLADGAAKFRQVISSLLQLSKVPVMSPIPLPEGVNATVADFHSYVPQIRHPSIF